MSDRKYIADQILDHFEDRVRETVEYQPYLDLVHRYWRQEINDLIDQVEVIKASARG